MDVLSRLLGIEDGTLTYVEAGLRHAWPSFVLLLLIVAAVGFVAMLYRREHGLTLVRRITLATLRSLAFALVLIVLFEPVLGLELAVRVRSNVLVLVDVSQSMALADRRTTPEAQREAAMALGVLSFEDRNQPVPSAQRDRVSGVPRLELARAALQNEEVQLLGRLAADHHVRLFSFGQGVEGIGGIDDGSAGLPPELLALEADQPATELGVALQEAASRFGGQTIAGVIVLTDGASNQGLDPIDAARALGQRRVPVYPVGIGLADPPDLAIAGVVVQDTVFARDAVPVRVHLRSSGYAGRTVELVAAVDGRTVARQQVTLADSGNQFEEITFVPEPRAGSLKLEVSAETLTDEATIDNNRSTRNVRVIDDKIRVLYVEAEPRWEYRYLRAVLLRDRRLDTYFLMTLGDQELASASDRHIQRFPDQAQELFKYDLIIIGDVPASYFSRQQLELVQQLVRERGGSVLMLAGRREAPMSYLGTPLEPVLAVRPATGTLVQIADEVAPRITDEGRQSGLTLLDPDPRRSQDLWSLVRPLYELPPLIGAKAGATVLLDGGAVLPGGDGKPYPLVAWHRYGSGKSMYVGTDQLWRLRFKRGDEYHTRFWGQSIQFLALSRLLGENRRVRVELERSDYKVGQRVPIFAHALTEGYEPLDMMQLEVQVEALDEQSATRTLALQPVPDSPGLYQGVFVPDAEGRYRLNPQGVDPEAAAPAELNVESVPLEMLQPAMQAGLLRQIADVSGGRFFRMHELPELAEALSTEPRTMIVRREKELWDSPLVLIVLIGLLGGEWMLRRQANLV